MMSNTKISAIVCLLILSCLQSSNKVSSDVVPSEKVEAANDGSENDRQPAEGPKSRDILPSFFNFDRFKTLFNKTYGSITEELARKKLFLGKAFRAFISAVGYKYGTRSSYLAINAMSDWTPDEVKRLYSGGLKISKKRGDPALKEKKEDNVETNNQKEDSDSVVPAIDEGEISKILSDIDENSSFPGYKEIIQELKSFTARRVKRENSRKHDLSVDDLIKVPIEEEQVLSDRIPSNNPNYVPPELRSTGFERMSGVERPLSKNSADTVMKSNGRNFAQKLIESFTSKFRSPSERRPVHIDDDLPREVEQLRQKVSYMTEQMEKQLHYYQITHDQKFFSDSSPTIATLFSGAERRSPKEKRIEKQIKELQKNLRMLKMSSDVLERIQVKLYDMKASEPPSSNKPVSSNPSYYVAPEFYKPVSYNQVIIDHRSSNCFFPPRDQGFCGSCYAFATIALYEWIYCMTTGNRVGFSEQYLVDCGETVGLVGCYGGAYDDVPRFVEKFGLELRQNYPYTQIEDQCPYNEQQISNHPETMGYIRINDIDFLNISPMHVDYYLTGGPILAAIKVNSEYAEYGGGVDKLEKCGTEGYHAVLIIGSGWEDGLDYWIIRNSLGPNWGEKGYFRLSRRTPCFEPENFFIPSMNANTRYFKNENGYYNENMIKERYGTKFVPNYDGVKAMRAQLISLMAKLKEIKRAARGRDS